MRRRAKQLLKTRPPTTHALAPRVDRATQRATAILQSVCHSPPPKWDPRAFSFEWDMAAEESLSRLIKAHVGGFKRLHADLTGRASESTCVSEHEFMRLTQPIVVASFAPRTLLSEIYQNVALLERCVAGEGGGGGRARRRACGAARPPPRVVGALTPPLPPTPPPPFPPLFQQVWQRR